jgi:hypothetical protein
VEKVMLAVGFRPFSLVEKRFSTFARLLFFSAGLAESQGYTVDIKSRRYVSEYRWDEKI